MTPAVRRTYAPGGKTPVQEAWRRKGRISAISAVTVGPRLRRPGLVSRLLPDDANAHGEDTAALLAQLRDRLRGPMTPLWDRSKIHSKAKVVKAYLAEHPEIVAEDFPGYAPELNPDEMVWGWTKHGRLSNYAAPDTVALRSSVVAELEDLRQHPYELWDFIEHTGLPIPL